MPRTSQMRTSKFLKQDDVGRGALLTITGCVQMNVAAEGAPVEHKWCLTFREEDKPLVLNSTNIQLCERICGSDNTDDWIGKRVVAYTDPTVSYAGKVTGGIRLRAPKPGAVPPPPPVVDEPLTDDDIPFMWLLPLATAVLFSGLFA